jgi:hypothetical protein
MRGLQRTMIEMGTLCKFLGVALQELPNEQMPCRVATAAEYLGIATIVIARIKDGERLAYEEVEAAMCAEERMWT